MLNITTISDVIYRDCRYNLIRIAEGYRATPYIDSQGNVTIGIGFNLHAAVIRNRLLSELGIQNGTQAFNNITNILRNNYQYSTEQERLTLQNNINQMLRVNGLVSLTDPQIQNIFSDLIAGFETTVNSWMQKHAIPTIGNSRERAALVSLAYNSKVEENRQSPNYGYPTTLVRKGDVGSKTT
jgi:GH24 family phage-related lysozyme (muramidase)